jgi:hypothetical protein
MVLERKSESPYRSVSPGQNLVSDQLLGRVVYNQGTLTCLVVGEFILSRSETKVHSVPSEIGSCTVKRR